MVNSYGLSVEYWPVNIPEEYFLNIVPRPLCALIAHAQRRRECAVRRLRKLWVRDWVLSIDPMQKGVSLFLSYTAWMYLRVLHHVKEHLKISNFLQFEGHSSKSFKVRAISDLRDLYGNKIQGLTSLDSNFCNLHDWFLGRKYWYHSKDPVQISISVQFQHCTWTSWWVIGT